MSGGSFNYLYCKDIEDLIHEEEQLREMEKELINLGFSGIAGITKGIREKIEKFKSDIQPKIELIREIWKAVELYYSNDIGIDGIHKAVEKFRVSERNKR